MGGLILKHDMLSVQTIKLRRLLSPVPALRFSSAALQSLLVHSGAPGHTGHPGKPSTAQLLGPQRRIYTGTHRVEERWHLPEPSFR